MVLEVVHDVGAPQEGVAEHGRELPGRHDAEEARLGASVGEGRREAGRRRVAPLRSQHELVQLHRDDGLAEAEVDGRGAAGERARHERDAVLAVELGPDRVHDAGGQVVGQVRQAAARVEEDGFGAAGGDRDRVAAVLDEAEVGEGDDELRRGRVAVRGLDRQRLELADVLLRVDAAEQQRARRGVQVVQPQAVGVRVDLTAAPHELGQIRVRPRRAARDGGLVGHVADAQDALAGRGAVADPDLEVVEDHVPDADRVDGVVAPRAGPVDVGYAKVAVDVSVRRRGVGVVRAGLPAGVVDGPAERRRSGVRPQITAASVQMEANLLRRRAEAGVQQVKIALETCQLGPRRIQGGVETERAQGDAPCCQARRRPCRPPAAFVAYPLPRGPRRVSAGGPSSRLSVGRRRLEASEAPSRCRTATPP